MSPNEDAMNRINPTAREAYKQEGPGVGAGAGALEWCERLSGKKPEKGDFILEVGAGQCELLIELAQREIMTCGVDIAEACLAKLEGVSPDVMKFLRLHICDVSHDKLPWPTNTFDFAFCTETIEHVANPYYMVSEVKRTLRHGGLFVLAFPMPEDNLGYGGGQHAHVYPGFLTKDSFERFMRQMYFKFVNRQANGSSAWYAFKNYKGEGMVDVFHMIAGNYENERDLYGVLDDWN